MVRLRFCVVFCIIGKIFLFSQNMKKVDSLNHLLSGKIHDTLRITILGSLVEEYYLIEPKRTEELLNEVLRVAENKHEGANDQEKKFYAMSIYTSLNNIGFIHKKMGNIKSAAEYYFRALKSAEANDYTTGIANSAINIGSLYKTMNNYEKAFEYYNIALSSSKKIGYRQGIAQSYKSIAGYYKHRNETDKAIEYLHRAISQYMELGLRSQVSTCYNNIADTYIKTKEYEKALHYLDTALYHNDSVEDRESRTIIYNNFGRIYLLLKQPDKAIQHLRIAEQLQQKVKYPENYLTTQYCFYSAYKQKGDHRSALEYYLRYEVYNDSINSMKNREDLMTADLRHSFEKKEIEIRKEQEKKDLAAIEENRRQRVISITTGAVLMITIVFSIFIFRNYREKKKINIQLAASNKEINLQKELIEEKQKEILDSINYAQQIQRTLLANHEFANQFIPDSFVMFQPKDIVSGDFYWATKKEDRFYLAVCDSTGHGVPGAFMSLLNINFLNEAITEKGLREPHEIFNFVRQRLIANLSQSGRKDGMDGILLCMRDNGVISYCGANNGPVVVTDGKLTEFPSDKMPVGRGESETSFTLHNLPAKKGDMIFLYTDGYADQFGGPKGKKFKYKQLDQLLLGNSTLNVEEQKKQLEVTFSEWKGSLEQVDDVCVLGVKL